MIDKVPAAAALLIAFGVMAIIAGFGTGIGKYMFAFVLIFAMVWFIGQGTQSHVIHWSSLLSGSGVMPGTRARPGVFQVQ